MTLMEFSMIPLDQGASFSRFVARTLDIVDQSGLEYRLSPMGTVVEGEWDELQVLLDRCFKAMQEVSRRISLNVKYDYRKGRSGRLVTKIESVEAAVGRELKKS